MKLLVIGADSNYAIERFYLKYWSAHGKNITVEFFPAQNIFYKYYNKNSLNKIIFKLGISAIYNKINKKLVRKIDVFQPDLIFIFKGMEVFPTSLLLAKEKGIKLINYNPDNPFIFSGRGSGNSNITKSIGLYDYHFTYSVDIKKQIDLQFNIPTSILPFGFDIDESVYNLALNKDEIHKVCFIGNPDEFRAKLIQSLANKGIEIDTEFLSFSTNPMEFLLNLNGVNGKDGMVQPNAYLTPKEIINKAGHWSTLLNRSPDDDSEFFCRVLLHSNEIIYDKTSINYYRKSLNLLSGGKTFHHAKGALKTVELKTQIILEYIYTPKVKKTLAKNFAKIAYSYGSYYPIIIFDVKKQMNEILGYKKFPLVGGKYFKFLSFIIGFENAIYIKNKLKGE